MSEATEESHQLLLGDCWWEAADEYSTVLCHFTQYRHLRLEDDTSCAEPIRRRHGLTVQSGLDIGWHCWLFQSISVVLAESLQTVSYDQTRKASSHTA